MGVDFDLAVEFDLRFEDDLIVDFDFNPYLNLKIKLKSNQDV